MISSSVSAVIPVFNDNLALSRAIPVAIKALEEITGSFELIIAEDASDDGSYELAREWSLHDDRIIILHRDRRLGRGSALTNAWKQSSGEIFCYFDVDMATDMSGLPRLLYAIEDGYDGATGSRLLPGSVVLRSHDREITSRTYNGLVRFILGSTIRDHQCGFKAFHRKTLATVLPYVRDTHWFWDTEVLICCQCKGFSLAELPIKWTQGPGTTVKTLDIYSMGRSIVNLWFRLHTFGTYPKPNIPKHKGSSQERVSKEQSNR